jgi:hypothetical protein
MKIKLKFSWARGRSPASDSWPSAYTRESLLTMCKYVKVELGDVVEFSALRIYVNSEDKPRNEANENSTRIGKLKF